MLFAGRCATFVTSRYIRMDRTPVIQLKKHYQLISVQLKMAIFLFVHTIMDHRAELLQNRDRLLLYSLFQMKLLFTCDKTSQWSTCISAHRVYRFSTGWVHIAHTSWRAFRTIFCSRVCVCVRVLNPVGAHSNCLLTPITFIIISVFFFLRFFNIIWVFASLPIGSECFLQRFIEPLDSRGTLLFLSFFLLLFLSLPFFLLVFLSLPFFLGPYSSPHILVLT